MGQDFFKNLPSEIITDILSRLPVRTIAISKCVCKPWLHLLETDHFVNSHLSKSAPALAVSMPATDSNWFKVFELEDEVDLDLDRPYDPITKFDFPHRATVGGSTNGLLFLHKFDAHYVCNPITREYIEFHCHSRARGVGYGFGASKISGQHKVVCINPAESDCQVYTLGTGLWRRVEATASFEFSSRYFGTFFNGNLHWVVSISDSNSNDKRWICCFDVETEYFSIFAAPPLILQGDLYTLRNCLCFCDDSSGNFNEVVIWLMKKYEVDKCWSKEYVIAPNPDFSVFGFGLVQPIKVFRDGGILMLYDDIFYYYSNKTKTHHQIGLFGAEDDDYCTNLMLLTPTFLSLKSFSMENVISF